MVRRRLDWVVEGVEKGDIIPSSFGRGERAGRGWG